MPMDDVILTRDCWVERSGGGDPRPLHVEFLRPYPVDSETVLASFRIRCDYFEDVEALKAGDDVQAMSLMLGHAWSCLKGKARQGYEIYWMTRGDLDYFDFWAYREKPNRHGPRSVFQEAVMAALSHGPERFLQPSHRVAVDETDLSIVTYRVLSSGADALEYRIDAETSQRLGPEGTAKYLGELLLRDTPGGRRLLGLDPGT